MQLPRVLRVVATTGVTAFTGSIDQSARINSAHVVVRARAANAAAVFVGFPSYTAPPSTVGFTPPADLTAATQDTIQLSPGESYEFKIPGWGVEHGEFFDLRRFYVKGNGTDVLEVIRRETIDA